MHSKILTPYIFEVFKLIIKSMKLKDVILMDCYDIVIHCLHGLNDFPIVFLDS